jgi:hypothetical protein
MATQPTDTYKKIYEPMDQAGGGGLAKLYKPSGGKYGYVNVLKDYEWSLSPSYIRDTAPAVILKEFEVNESAIKRQLFFYGAGVTGQTGGDTPGGILSPYAELFPKDKPTGFVYQFPYLTDINFQLNTPQWQSLDTLEQGQKFASSVAGVVGGQGAAATTEAILGAAGGAYMGVQAMSYPKIGIMDRPKLWQSHDFRTTEIRFPLFNTHTLNVWQRNRDLCWLLINQNLYNKRDFITSVPPVFYELYVPGQHYSIASCVTNITITNRGNMRRMVGSDEMESNVPDVYDVQITLTDMVMPSKNLLQTLENRTVTVQVFQSETGRGVQASEATQRAAQQIGEGSGIPQIPVNKPANTSQ